MRALPILAVALACGCTPMQWQKADVSAEQLRADQQDCQQRAWREAQYSAWAYTSRTEPVVVGPGAAIFPNSAMVDPYGNQMMEEYRLAQFCMESKGYALVPVPKK